MQLATQPWRSISIDVTRRSPENRNKKPPEGEAHHFFAHMTQEREICEREH
jgi:hypothetical protein